MIVVDKTTPHSMGRVYLMENRSVMTRSFRISGRVQGVGFRAYVQRMGWTCECAGEVWNTRSGNVEGLVAGSPEAVEKFCGLLREGPGWVQAVQVDEILLNELPEGFTIGWTR